MELSKVIEVNQENLTEQVSAHIQDEVQASQAAIPISITTAQNPTPIASNIEIPANGQVVSHIPAQVVGPIAGPLPTSLTHETDEVVEAVVESMLADDDNSTGKKRKYSNIALGLSTDEVSEARRKMNILLQIQERAQDELHQAEEHLKLAHIRVETAKKNIEITKQTLQDGAEEFTDALLQEPTHWNTMYRKMVEYKEKHGNVDVKRNPLKSEKEANPEIVKLGSWVGRVRLEARRPPGHPEHIEPYKVVALNRLGFNWDPRENYWMEKYEELKLYMKTHGKHKMPTRKEPLGVWCDGQVLEYNKFHAKTKPCYITQERIDLLNEIGFVWDRMGTAWRDSYEELKKYREINGHCHVPVNYGDKTLFRWIAKQRKKYKNFQEGSKPALTEEQVKMLKAIDFFEPSEQRLAKFNAQKERMPKKERKGSMSKGKGRGRPKSKSLIPVEVQQAMIINPSPSPMMPFMYTPHPMMPLQQLMPIQTPIAPPLMSPGPYTDAQRVEEKAETEEELANETQSSLEDKEEKHLMKTEESSNTNSAADEEETEEKEESKELELGGEFAKEIKPELEEFNLGSEEKFDNDKEIDEDEINEEDTINENKQPYSVSEDREMNSKTKSDENGQTIVETKKNSQRDVKSVEV